MTIAEAAKAAFPEGKGIVRACWEFDLDIIRGADGTCACRLKEGGIVPAWQPFAEDILADDWEITA